MADQANGSNGLLAPQGTDFAVQVRVEQVREMILVVLSFSCGPIAFASYLEPKIARQIAMTIRDAAASAETTLVKPPSALVNPGQA
jgi:ABC-type enterobactin transport system permease subunit